jgi:fructose-1,6-bisphosphatase/inositol monophosphatase family enzyme
LLRIRHGAVKARPPGVLSAITKEGMQPLNKNLLRLSDEIRLRLMRLQDAIRDYLIQSRATPFAMHDVERISAADTIYGIDAKIEPILARFFQEWAGETGPIVLVAEGLEDAGGREVPERVFPDGARAADALIRVIVDPIDGTRGLMYDKRSAWSLAGVAPNRGSATKLSDIEVAVMTELPTSKAGFADQLWAMRGEGAAGQRIDLRNGPSAPLPLRPSAAATIAHGFASVSNFFPGTKVLASELMEQIAGRLIGAADVHRATVFDDQYISTGGQWYELIIGHDRFTADLRPSLYRLRGLAEGMCCHPYDCAAKLIAEEAGVILTDAQGKPLDGPLDTTTGLDWVGYANDALRKQIEPVVMEFLRQRVQGSAKSDPT